MSSSATKTPSSSRGDRVRELRIVERYASGDVLTAIAAEECVCLKTVRNIARRHSIPRRLPDRTARNARIIARYADGEPAVWLGMFDGDGSGGPRRSHGRPRIDWYGTAAVMRQCSTFWASRLTLSTGGAPTVAAHARGLSKVALYGANAALAAQVMLKACPVSNKRKRLALDEVANYRPRSRREPAL